MIFIESGAPMPTGVYICHCGSNIAGTIDIEDVRNMQKIKRR